MAHFVLEMSIFFNIKTERHVTKLKLKNDIRTRNY